MELRHHGILGQKWGVRNGPPYPLSGGDYTPSQRKAISNKRKSGNSIYNKKHFDEVLKVDKTTLSTLSYDKDRTKNADMFYATHHALDKHQYNALFNRPIPQTVYDKDGKAIGTGSFMKYRIDNSLKTDLKVASEDSGAKVFMDLYKKDRDFYNFVTDRERMQGYFVNDKYKFKGYREAAAVLGKMRRKGRDMYNQRTKFFHACKEVGYGAVLDTNDAIYGGFKAKSPIIVFDMEQVVPKDVYRTNLTDQKFSTLVLVGRKLLGL